ncbi:MULTISPECIES: Fur family transcriptional regulator [unclassified Sphingomonas]|uniref:Fur family transcriptional regulator n=1 Tax=unclassified Sphingomonas TaxID=196159 RepID=UPI001607F760|nr:MULTISPECIES: transcriptional repressor [unclassified Sphingomonas]MBB3349259.1 Fur family zinc uptake transcriptional regulator [Sphingomonas sp. BK069]MBB3474295.1 Fur family zinc uptake transcriptional regulator [Sphingomonas sp. BK345]
MATMHHHVDLSGDALLTAAAAATESAGQQWTAMREKVFAALTSFDKPASAYDITEALSKTEGRRIAANSVYRILDLFVAANVAQRIESVNAYVANAHPGCRHDCIFLICGECGDTQHVDDEDAAEGVRRAATHSGFTAQRPVLEIHGVCRRCAPSD